MKEREEERSTPGEGSQTACEEHHNGAGVSLQPLERAPLEQIPTLQTMEDSTVE